MIHHLSQQIMQQRFAVPQHQLQHQQVQQQQLYAQQGAAAAQQQAAQHAAMMAHAHAHVAPPAVPITQQHAQQQGVHRPDRHFPVRYVPRSFFMDERKRQTLRQQNRLLTARLLPEDPQFGDVPVSLRGGLYHSLWPLPSAAVRDDDPPKQSEYTATSYKVTCASDSCCYFVRRVVGCRVPETFAQVAVEPWMELRGGEVAVPYERRRGAPPREPAPHPGIVGIHDVFASNGRSLIVPVHFFFSVLCFIFMFNHEYFLNRNTTAFEDDSVSLCFVYDFMPGAVTVHQRYFGELAEPGGPPAVPERLVWSYLLQCCSALVSVHAAGLACRNISAKRSGLRKNTHIIRPTQIDSFFIRMRACARVPFYALSAV